MEVIAPVGAGRTDRESPQIRRDGTDGGGHEGGLRSIDTTSITLEFCTWLESIAQISAAVNNMEPLANVLNTIASTTCRLLGYDFGAVLLPDQDRLVIRGSYGLAPGYIDTINSEKPIRIGSGPYAEGPTSRAFTSHRPVVVRDYREDPSVGPWAGVAVEQDYRSLVSIPLIVSGTAVGALNYYTRAVHEFSGDEILLLSTIGNLAAVAFETARLRDQERATITGLRESRRSIQRQAKMLERSESIHAELTWRVLDNAGLPAIAEALSRILSASIVIRDSDGSVLATAAVGGVLATVPTGLLQDPTLAERFSNAIDAREPFELLPSDCPLLDARAFVAPVVIGTDVVGNLWALDPEPSLGPLERRALEHGTTVVALELLKQRIASEVADRLAGELLDDLLADRVPDQDIARARAKHLGHDLGAPHAVIVAAADPAVERTSVSSSAPQFWQLRRVVGLLLRRLHLDALVGDREGALVIMLAEGSGGRASAIDVADALRRDVHAYLSGTTASVALGPWVEDIGEMARSYRIARGALQLSQRHGHPDRTISTERLGVHGLLLSVDRLDALASFAEDTLGPLKRYDDGRGGELVGTLRAYLAHGCRPGATAGALVIHPNTVAYRLRRIEALLGIDLSRPDARLQVQLAMIVDDIVGGSAEGNVDSVAGSA